MTESNPLKSEVISLVARVSVSIIILAAGLYVILSDGYPEKTR